MGTRGSTVTRGRLQDGSSEAVIGVDLVQMGNIEMITSGGNTNGQG